MSGRLAHWPTTLRRAILRRLARVARCYRRRMHGRECVNRNAVKPSACLGILGASVRMRRAETGR